MNTIKNLCSLIALLLLTSMAGYAQDMDDEFGHLQGREKIRAARVAYITQRLNLSPDESQAFWALHNEYEDKKRALKSRRDRSPALEAMSDAEVEQMIETRFEVQQELLNLERTYYQKFKQVISSRKVALFYKADKEFRLELLKRVREERKNRKHSGPGKRFGN